MAKLSVILPSRNEKYLIPTIRDIFAKARGEIEVVAILEGYWPDDWATVTATYPNLHTIHHAQPKGMRAAINAGVASAISRRTKYILKSDAHCMFGEGFDEILKAELRPDWVVIPRRKRLNPEKWELTDTHKPDIDYHYLSFPDDPNDFGGPGLNGKVWAERAVERKDLLLDEEMSSQGSAWCMYAKYFVELELMDETNYGPFWNEAQEILLKCWLSGGQGMVNKKTWYAHWHKGKAGRGYRLEESALTQGATYTKKWLFNEAWPKQTLPFKTLVERFWPVPTWPENWEERVYQTKQAMVVNRFIREVQGQVVSKAEVMAKMNDRPEPQLQIHAATYGLGRGLGPNADLDVTERLQSLVKDGSLDIVVNNSTLCPDQNPYRGKKKKLWVTYSINGGKPVTIERQEKEWLIIGAAAAAGEAVKEVEQFIEDTRAKVAELRHLSSDSGQRVVDKVFPLGPMTAAALNDYLIRKFHISDRRLRAPMPVELRDFNRNDLARLFAELGFKYGAEIGVAEGHYSEILCQSIPNLHLHCVDPWTRYSGNPRAHSDEHQEFSRKETERKLKDYHATIHADYSMNVVRDFPDNPPQLDFVYIDANHQFDYVMQDLIEWSKRVRSGGIVAGDDYYAMKHQGGVVTAVDAYVKGCGINLWFICDAPNSVDFFFVRP